jgi:hypothetical protein
MRHAKEAMCRQRKEVLQQAFEYADEYVLEETDCPTFGDIPTAGAKFGQRRSRERHPSLRFGKNGDIGSSCSTGPPTILIRRMLDLTYPMRTRRRINLASGFSKSVI